MKKIFTFVAAALMALNVFAATETVLDVNFAEFASEQIGTLGGSNITPTFGEQVSKMNTNVYSLSVTGLLDADKIFINRNSDVLLRYADIRTIGLYSKSTPTVVIPDLKANDIVEIAWNAGGKSDDGTYWEIDSMLTSLGNVEVTGDWGEYAFSHTSDGTERTINYTTRQLKVQADGDVRFAIPSVKGDGSNWKIFIAYIKITRESGSEPTPDPEPAAFDVNFANYAATTIGTLGGSNITPTFGEQVNMMNTNVYSLSVAGLIEADKLFVNRNADMLVRYSDVRSIGLYSKSTPTFVIPGLKKDDIVEIAWNAGGKSDGTYWEIDSTLTSLGNVEVTGEWGEYAFSHTSGGTQRTINYSTRQLKVLADGDVRFAIPSVKGDGSNWKIYIAYIKVLAAEPEETNYFLKNNWNLGEWTWKQMTKDGDVYVLDSVVFGGTGVNLNTAASDENSAWIPLEKIKGDSIVAADTVTLKLAINETDTVITATLIGRPEQEEVVYYLTGTFNSWAPADENYVFVANPEKEGEYMLHTTLAVGDGIKVISSTGVWYPDGMGNEYTVDAAHTGVNTIYFRPDGQGGEGWYNGFFYLETTSPEGVENANAKSAVIKAIENGQVVILRDGVRYNVLGAKL